MPPSEGTVFITGGTGGLGLAMARAPVAAGARVFITGRDPARPEAALPVLAAMAPGAAGDVGDEQQVASAFDAAHGLGNGSALWRRRTSPTTSWSLGPSSSAVSDGARGVPST